MVDKSISAGSYINVIELISAALPLSEEEENCINILRNAILDGANSGIAPNFNPENHLNKLKDNKNKGALEF